MKILLAFGVAFVLAISSCGKKEGPAPAPAAPTNLTLAAVVSTDNSGNVSFTSTATNAVVYTFDFGDGTSPVVVAVGSVTHQYFSSGTYTATVSAKSSSNGPAATKSITVTVVIAQAIVWSDEFNTDGAPDPSKWGYDLGAGGWGNNEAQYYTNRPENASVSGGSLKINLKKESFSGSSYTSARLLSKGKYSFKYGKIEVKAKLAAGGGTWPAIWMLGDNISTVPWPGCGEIDIMEHVGNQLNKIYGTLHHPGHSGANGDGAQVMISNVTTEFHRYALEWSPSTIKFLVDDLPFYTFGNSSGLPFNQNFFIILNVAMGGNFGGVIDPAFTATTMEIDYVRVYN